MYKGKAASMQRGAAVRDDARMSREDFNKQTRITLAKDEVGHFQAGQITKEKFLDELRPLIKCMARNRFRKPADVARLLNKWGIKTASGAQWSPRLVWFLLGFLYEKPAKPAAQKAKPPQSHIKSGDVLPPQQLAPYSGAIMGGAAATALVSREELARLLSERFNVVLER